MSSYWMAMLGGQVRYVDVGGVSTRILEAGDANAETTIVLLHGAGGHNENWVTNVVSLASAGHVVAPDLLGHGLNARPERPYTFRAVIDHIKELLDIIGASNVCLVGLSIGGLVAYHVGAERPAQVKKLVLVCSGGVTPNGPSDNTLPRLSEGTANLFDNPSIDAVRTRFENMINLPDKLSPEMVECREWFLRFPGAKETVVSVLADYDDHREQYDAGPSLLKGIEAKTLYCWGDHNHPGPEIAHQAAALQQDASVEVFADSGHWPHVEEEAKFHDVMRAFLAR